MGDRSLGHGVILDNYDSFTHNLAQALGSAGASVEVHRNDAVTLTELEQRDPDFLVISAGPGGPPSSADPSGAGIAPAAISHFRGSIPILGVCLGLQILAEQIGGVVRPTRRPVHGKRDVVWHDGSGIFARLPNPFVAARYHSLAVCAASLPSAIAVRAWTEDRTVMAFGIPGEPTWAVQFHPESFMTPEGALLFEAFLDGGVCPETASESIDVSEEWATSEAAIRATLASSTAAESEAGVMR